MDCRAILGLTRLLIERAESFRRPRKLVRGVWVTQYKDMGQAVPHKWILRIRQPGARTLTISA
jgi:hypothetical protein